MTKLKLIEKERNTVGTLYGLFQDGLGTFGVWVLKANYAGHVKGGIVYTWRYCAKNMDEAAARVFLKKKLRGKAK